MMTSAIYRHERQDTSREKGRSRRVGFPARPAAKADDEAKGQGGMTAIQLADQIAAVARATLERNAEIEKEVGR